MHKDTIFNKDYDYKALKLLNPELSNFFSETEFGTTTFDFTNPEAVYQLNKTLLHKYFKIDYWQLPEAYLCPAVPGRLDYLLHLKEYIDLPDVKIKGLDIGTGASAIYPILAVKHLGWQMRGVDSNAIAIASAKDIVSKNKLEGKIDIVLQPNNGDIFKGIIQPTDYFHFAMCNPPFYASEAEAMKATFRKNKNLGNIKEGKMARNFGGISKELWCNGGEALFVKRMIKESVAYSKQVDVFSSLISRKEHLSPLEKLIAKKGATSYILKMKHGNKASHILTWKF